MESCRRGPSPLPSAPPSLSAPSAGPARQGAPAPSSSGQPSRPERVGPPGPAPTVPRGRAPSGGPCALPGRGRGGGGARGGSDLGPAEPLPFYGNEGPGAGIESNIRALGGGTWGGGARGARWPPTGRGWAARLCLPRAGLWLCEGPWRWVTVLPAGGEGLSVGNGHRKFPEQGRFPGTKSPAPSPRLELVQKSARPEVTRSRTWRAGFGTWKL